MISSETLRDLLVYNNTMTEYNNHDSHHVNGSSTHRLQALRDLWPVVAIQQLQATGRVEVASYG